MATSPHTLTAEVLLRLATPRALVRGLSQLGLQWAPVPLDQVPAGQPGLYAWVVAGSVDPLDGGVLYVGVGRAGEGGVRQRLLAEKGWATEDAYHAHGRAVRGTGAVPLAGPVVQSEVDLAWLDDALVEWPGYGGAELVRGLVEGRQRDVVLTAERVAIRMAVHLGDTAPPVNSQFATAWASNAPEDWAGYAAARWLLATAA